MGAERMGNEEVITALSIPLQRLLAFERFHMYRPELFQDTRRDQAFDVRYFPQNCAAVRLPCFWIKRKHFYVRTATSGGLSGPSLFGEGKSGQDVLFPVHPLSLKSYSAFLKDVGARDAAGDGLLIWAVPTASTRTLVAWPEGAPGRALFLKMSLFSPIFGDRRLHRWKVERSVGLSKMVLNSAAFLPRQLGYFPETIGLVPRRMQDGGLIVRSIPDEVRQGDEVIAPLFALFGESGCKTPLLVELLQGKGLQPLQFVEDVLCNQFARLWLDLTMMSGLIFESHGQDMMLRLTDSFSPARFMYRDFEGLQVDWVMHRRGGMRTSGRMAHDWSWQEAYGGWAYRHGDEAWYKWQISLYGYMRLVLDALDSSMRDWQLRGLISGYPDERDWIFRMFSKAMGDTIERMFGLRIAGGYNIYQSLNSFLVSLARVRRRVLLGG